MEISGSQIKLLKRLYKTDILLSDFSDSEKGEIEYLGKRGFIKYSKEDTDSRIAPTIVCIQSAGKAFYDSYVRDRRRWYIPVVLSIVAIVISLFALYKSGQVINVYIDENKMNTVTAENPPANADNKQGKFGYL